MNRYIKYGATNSVLRDSERVAGEMGKISKQGGAVETPPGWWVPFWTVVRRLKLGPMRETRESGFDVRSGVWLAYLILGVLAICVYSLFPKIP